MEDILRMMKKDIYMEEINQEFQENLINKVIIIIIVIDYQIHNGLIKQFKISKIYNKRNNKTMIYLKNSISEIYKNSKKILNKIKNLNRKILLINQIKRNSNL